MTKSSSAIKPDAGNPHVRFDEGEVASAATPRRGSLLYKRLTLALFVSFAAACAMVDDPIAFQGTATTENTAVH